MTGAPLALSIWKWKGGIMPTLKPRGSNRAMRLAAFLEVMLMIVFSAPECWSGFDLCHNWAIESAAFLQFFFEALAVACCSGE